MIRYVISPAELEKRVNTTVNNWLARAKVFTEKAKKAKKAVEGVGIWSEIKPLFLAIQGNKCIYCERMLPSSELGLVEHDVEHYRPKNRVTEWPAAKDLKALGVAAYPFPTGMAAPTGYFSLAFALSNYAAACKTCNSALKADRFPIAGKRAVPPVTPAKLKAEKPFLLLPLAKGEEDPEKLIGFNGILPIPLVKDKTAFSHQRARVTIDFFRLASPARESDLLMDRLRSLSQYAMMRDRLKGASAAKKKQLGTMLKGLEAGTQPHASCVRAYARLCDKEPAQAKAMADLFDRLIEKGVKELFRNP